MKELVHTKIHSYLLVLIAFCLPIGKFTPLFIALICINWLVEADFKNKFKNLLENKIAFLFVCFYLLHLLGLCYSSNIDSGFFTLQVKISLLIFPIIFGSKKNKINDIKNTVYAFLAGVLFSSLIYLIRAVYLFIAYGANRFFYEEFSIYMHPSYFSMYLNLILTVIFLTLTNNSFQFKFISNFWKIVIILFLSFINMLLSSKLGLLTMTLIYVGFLIYFVIIYKKYFIGFIGSILLCSLILASIKMFPEVTARINRSLISITNPAISSSESESTAVRILIWSASNEVISNNFIFGTGTGDANDELLKEYENRKMTGAITNKLNAHNEYYQVFIGIGVIGFLFLILSIILPLYQAFNSKNAFYILFLLIIILNFFPESMLETKDGVMFYAFFNSLLCFGNSTTTTKIKNSN